MSGRVVFASSCSSSSAAQPRALACLVLLDHAGSARSQEQGAVSTGHPQNRQCQRGGRTDAVEHKQADQDGGKPDPEVRRKHLCHLVERAMPLLRQHRVDSGALLVPLVALARSPNSRERDVLARRRVRARDARRRRVGGDRVAGGRGEAPRGRGRGRRLGDVADQGRQDARRDRDLVRDVDELSTARRRTRSESPMGEDGTSGRTHDEGRHDKVERAEPRPAWNHHDDAASTAGPREYVSLQITLEGSGKQPTHSPAMKRWNWMMNVSSEHWPKKMKNLLLVDLRNGVALRRTQKARTGMADT